MKWREEVGYDSVKFWEVPQGLKDLLPEQIIGFDHANSPVVLTLFGKWDIKKVVQESGQGMALRCKWKTFESLKETMRNHRTPENIPVTQVCFINDLEGLSFRQLALPVLRAMSEYGRQFEANFPEIMKTNVVINAPWFFPMVFKCFAPFLSQKTMSKVHVFGKNREEWSTFLNEIIPHYVLPTMYGGSNDISL
ncbi:unnamed protein product [Allacma fusca]|uniref:CRAL-TRIO domain-containing protein n=1 Tax=Allacma fusca TaxID=39272 RepID=A0A8J2JQX2_9HEXA|nr:unnamed protein product [Allacma fusca]